MAQQQQLASINDSKSVLSIGLSSCGWAIDRTTEENRIISVAWSLDETKAVTTGDALFPYIKQPAALEIRFPGNGKILGVEKIVLHPLFRERAGTLTMDRARSEFETQGALVRHNCSVIFLKENIEQLTDARKREIDSSLSFKVDSKDGLSGNLADIDLALVLQTLTGAKKQGELIIVDSRNQPIAQLYCEDGRVVFARYRHLLNEMAINQIAATKLKGGFYFRPARRPSFAAKTIMTKPTDMLLLESYRRMDEIDSIRGTVGGEHAKLIRQGTEIDIRNLPDDIRSQAAALWYVADGLTENGKLWQLLNMDDYGIYTTIATLKQHGLINIAGNASLITDIVAAHDEKTLTVTPQLPLRASDPLSAIALSADSTCGVKNGSLMGAIDAYDSYHLIHNLPLLPDLAGTPLVKDGCVVAMHTGVLPCAPEISLIALQQCLWIDSVLQCLVSAGEKQTVKRITEAGEKFISSQPQFASQTASKTVGCVEVATIECPRCKSSSFDSARFCRDCKFEFIATAPTDVVETKPTILFASALTSVAILFGLMLFVCFIPQPNLARLPFAYLPHRPAIQINVEQANLKTGAWEEASSDKMFKNGDTIHLTIAIESPSYIYLLHQSNSGTPEMIYPRDDDQNKIRQRGEKITFPEKTEQQRGDRHYLVGMTIEGAPGVETIICLASQKPLNDMNDAENVQKAFRLTSEVSSWTSYPNGFELGESHLTKTPGASEKSGQNAVFVTKVAIAHDQ